MNWVRIAVLVRFARAVASTAPALRLSLLPLIDSIASELIAEPFDRYDPWAESGACFELMPGVSRLPEEWSS